jgi:hypothetical protein
MRFVISESVTSDAPLDRCTYRAYFYCRKGDAEVEESFSQHELVGEIARLTALGRPTAYYARALQCLQLLNGPTKDLSDAGSPTTSQTNRSPRAHSL